jgi:hypothetical protein
VIFIAILALNLRITRFWCRALCPLGALLGLALALVHSGSGETPGPLRGLQPLPARLPGRGRSHSRRAVA